MAPSRSHQQELLQVGLDVLVVDGEEGGRHVDDGLGQAVDVVVVACGQR